LKKNGSILHFVSVPDSEDGSRIIKTMKKAENGEVEAAINQWFIPKRSAGQPISWLVLREKALIFNHQLGVASIPNESPPQNKNLCWTFLVPLV
jgi:hypothetical protein